MVISIFSTPAEHRSFSGLIDQAVTETGRTGAIRSLVSYANMTIRECQALGLFARDLREEVVVSTANPHIWLRPRYHKSIRAVRYATQCVYPKLRLPGKVQNGLNYFFYAVDDSFAFKGAKVGEDIQLANYYWSVPLIYFGRLGVVTTTWPGGPYALRKAYFDVSTLTWMYLNGSNTAYVTTLGDLVEEELRRTTAENWLISEWYDTILEGTKAKILKQFNDPRAPLSFSLYKQLQKTLALTGGFEAEVGAMVGDDDG